MAEEVEQSAPEIDWQEKAKKILKANLVNLMKKVKAGKPLTANEVALLEKKASGGEPIDIAPAAAAASSSLAKNKARLADALEVSRKTIQRYSNHPDAPKPRPNGSLSIEEWRHFLQGKEVIDDLSEDKSELQAEQILLQNERIRNKIAIEKKLWIPRVVARQVFTQLITELKARDFNSINRTVMMAKTSSSTTDAIEEIRKDRIALWKSVENSEWYQPTKQ